MKNTVINRGANFKNTNNGNSVDFLCSGVIPASLKANQVICFQPPVAGSISASELTQAVIVTTAESVIAFKVRTLVIFLSKLSLGKMSFNVGLGES
ncbi:hypothetical protein [Lonsdalea quercina]|uniref:hypothetical protein n=1 Tax=Lonsdalea quercina TaxID=71657 RepID=UPI003976E459